MAFYRTYRPKTISELDKKDIRERMSALLSSNDIPHAFLFIGPRGTGKTSTARIVAKAVNCTKNKNTEPCNSCENCTAVISGNHMDVIEIDAASNRGIDQIRDLREKIALTPSMGTYKVYIIDEVHMLTREAFNALLKTLEEPPEHAIFILATTEPQKLPDTIISRCTRINFSMATNEELVHSLKRIVKAEKMKVPSDVLNTIAHAAQGSFRDAVKLLEQAKNEDKLTIEDIGSVTGTSLLVNDLADDIVKKNLSDALEKIEESNNQGTDFTLLLAGIIEHLHEKLLLNPEDQGLKTLLRYLMRAYSETKSASIAQLPLELAVIEYCNR